MAFYNRENRRSETRRRGGKIEERATEEARGGDQGSGEAESSPA
jgi:hypothetical protein